MIRKILYRLWFKKTLIQLIMKRNRLAIKNGINECIISEYKNTLEYEIAELHIEILDFMIESSKTILGMKCNKKWEGEDV